jgi:hypothetical protein
MARDYKLAALETDTDLVDSVTNPVARGERAGPPQT